MKTYYSPWILALALLWIPLASQAYNAEARLVSVTNPLRSNGIHIGDILERKVVIETPRAYQISKSALPMKGLARDGIELADIQVTTRQAGEKSIHDIDLRYQVFAASAAPVVMPLPEEIFAMSGGPKALSVKLPAWRFWFSPLVAGDLTTAKASLQPQFQPGPVDDHQERELLAAGLVLAAIAMFGMVYVNADGRWLPFMGGAFARTYRSLKRLPGRPGQGKQALFMLHQAFNHVHGANLFAPDVDRFVGAHPEFMAIREDIAGFFEQSNAVLYGQTQQDDGQLVDKLTAFCKRLRDCERRVA